MNKNLKKLPLCTCGCGERVSKPGNKYIKGHNARKYPIPEPQLCACGCGKLVKPGNKFIHGHTWIGRHQSTETCEKQKESANKRWENPLEREKAKERTIKQFEDPIACEKAQDAANKRWEDPLEHEKASIANKKAQGTPEARKANSERGLKRYADMDDPAQEIIIHHYIYDFNDWDKYTIKVTRSEHATIHNNLRWAKLEIPCINIMKGD